MAIDPSGTDPSLGNPIPEAVRRTMARTNAAARRAGVANVPDEDGVTPPATVVEKEPDQTPPATVVDKVPDQTPPVDWEQRYRTLQGKYDIEVPSAQSTIQSLRQVMAAMSEARDKVVTPPPPVQPPATVEIPDADVTEFGPDLISAARRWARAELAPVVADLRREVDDMKGTVTKAQVTTAETALQSRRESSMAYLDNDAEVGKVWRQVNGDSKFIQWLQQPDELTGQPLLPAMQHAFDSGNGNRTKLFVTRYLREHTGHEAQVSPQTQTPPVQEQAGRPTLEDFAAPGRSVAQTPPGAPAEKRLWTSQEIAAFYRDVNRGVFNTREPDRLRLENDIIAAAREGRVR